MQQTFSQFGSNLWTWTWSSLFIGAFSLLLTWGAARALEWAWFRPRRINRALREQGMSGTVYRPVVGDLIEHIRLNKQAYAKPMPLSHDIVPRVEPLLHRSMKEFGKQSFTWFGPMPRITIRDPELVREVLSNKSGHFERQKVSRLGRLLADGGLLVDDGKEWAKHRKIVNPAFHIEKLKRMLPAFATCCDELVDRWENSVGPDGSFELDVWPEMKILTGDVISKAAFGRTYQEDRRIFELQKKLTECFIKSLPITFFLPFSWYLPIENNRRMKQMSKEVHTIFEGIVAKREKAIQNGEATKNDLLGLLLESNMREMEQNGKSDSRLGLTIKEVIEECKTFYFAGHDTTAVLLTFTMVVLSMHPEWQEKAREEVLEHFGRNTPDFDGLSRLNIVTMILYEVLRLYPPIEMLYRQVYNTTQLGDVTIPAGVLIALPILFIHHDPDIWGHDATEFNPTRFAGGISKATKNGQLAFFPFGLGPHICLGQNFTLAQAKMGLSMILQHFKFELSEKYQHAPHLVFGLHPQYGTPIKFHRI